MSSVGMNRQPDCDCGEAYAGGNCRPYCSRKGGQALLRINALPFHEVQAVVDALQALAEPAVQLNWRYVAGVVVVKATGDFSAAVAAYDALAPAIQARLAASQATGLLVRSPLGLAAAPPSPNDFGGLVTLNPESAEFTGLPPGAGVRLTWDPAAGAFVGDPPPDCQLAPTDLPLQARIRAYLPLLKAATAVGGVVTDALLDQGAELLREAYTFPPPPQDWPGMASALERLAGWMEQGGPAAPAPAPAPTPFFTSANLNKWFERRSVGHSAEPVISMGDYLDPETEVFRHQDLMDSVKQALQAGGVLPPLPLSEREAVEISEDLSDTLAGAEIAEREIRLWSPLCTRQVTVHGVDQHGNEVSETLDVPRDGGWVVSQQSFAGDPGTLTYVIGGDAGAAAGDTVVVTRRPLVRYRRVDPAPARDTPCTERALSFVVVRNEPGKPQMKLPVPRSWKPGRFV